MSVLTFPRLHFQGFARIHAPTGNKNGLVDLSTNTVYMKGESFDYRRPVHEYHEYLHRLGPHFNAEGQWDENGPMSMAMGWDFGGNGHFAIEAKIVSTQREPGQVSQSDPVVGRSVDMWGHHNEYLGTTFNRARIFDCDPASNWTTTIMVGQFTFGRLGSSQEVPNMFSGSVEGLQPPRWQNFDYIQDLPEHCLNSEFKRADVYQFTVSKEAQDFFWGEEVALSPTVDLLRQAMRRDEVLGLVVQFSLSNMSAPMQPDSATFWELHGTIGLWYEGEMRTYPHGRLLTPSSSWESQDSSEWNVSGFKLSGTRQTKNLSSLLPMLGKMLSNLSVQVTPQGVSLNMITSVPCVGRGSQSEPGSTHAIGPKRDLGELELRTVKSQCLVARIPTQAYQQQAHQLTSGIIDVPLAASWQSLEDAIMQEGLCLIGTMPDGQRRVLVQEKEVNLLVDDACLFLEFPNRSSGEDYAVELEVRSFVRGQPAPIDTVYVSQYYNPRGMPQLRYEFERNPANSGQTFHFPHSSDLNILEFKPGKQTALGDFTPGCKLAINEEGRGTLTIRGCQSGTTRVLLSADPQFVPLEAKHPDEAELSYDNGDRLGFWSGVGWFAVRVMTDDWHLEEIADKDVDFDLIYKEILAYYELCFSFMKAEVFSLGDKCKVETYARLMWQMCNPRNKNKTYYMPPTRDLSEPKAMLLYKYLQNQQRVGYVPNPTPVPKGTQRTIQTREELVVALRQATEMEVAVMLQYIYAAYSIPNYVTGQEYVRRGLWTPEQLNLACGDGQEVRNYGFRGVLLEISHEEMIHFLLVNNILMAMGEPFYPACPDFGKINQDFPIDVDLALEPLNATSIQRFMRLETPDFLEEDLAGDGESDHPVTNRLHGYGSLSELYRQIREAIQNIPDLFLTKKGHAGGEHHLFLREDFNKNHPHYQLQVDDVDSALFAIDLITEQGEGCNVDSPKFAQSHYEQFRRMAETLAQQQFAPGKKGSPVVWNPAYPALRNPTLHYQDHNTNVVTVPETRAVMQICDESYSLMMQLMVQHFGLMPNASLRRSKLMNAAIDIMTGIVRPLGELLMTMPSGKRGKTAGPSFAIATPPGYIPTPELAYTALSRRFENLSYRARECEAISTTVTEMFDFYVNFFASMLN
ncbi:MAG: isovaleryl-CoA dehydrogenase [Stigonema ocellatum SAG 48.90 = DSM 106950]|nr:isovaleryl-CoA dehydrogenase [Stigonema ocellatum SAG 48.90 = DSM 106950]